jgi:DNA-directed RNA polymerase subunit RPC12/RpoP
MGWTSYPCPNCGQAQTEQHENGQTINPKLCAACSEKEKEKHDEKAEVASKRGR